MIAKNGAILLGVSLASALLGYYISTTQTVELSPVRTKSRWYTTDPPDVKKLVVVTRIHQQEASNMIDIDRVVSFVEASLKYASKVFVSIFTVFMMTSKVCVRILSRLYKDA